MLFLGVHGISVEAGLSTPNLAEAETNRRLVQSARRVVVVADHTKWGTVGLSSFASLEQVDTLVTDAGLPAAARAEIAEHLRGLVVAGEPVGVAGAERGGRGAQTYGFEQDLTACQLPHYAWRMTHRLRQVGLDYAANAPLRLVFVAESTASPDEIFSALTDVEKWPTWYRQVTRARSTEDGEGREIHLMGLTRFHETVLAADPAGLYAYRVDETNAPGVRALLEEWRLAPSATAGGTRVQYTFAVDGTALLRAAIRLSGPGLRRSFRGAIRRLDQQLAAGV